MTMAVRNIETSADKAASRGGAALRFSDAGFWWLVLPAFLFFLIFFVVPTVSLFALAFNKSVAGVISLSSTISFDNFVRIFTRDMYYGAILRSIGIAATVSVISLFFGYPLAYVIAKTVNPGRNTLLMILVLSSMQLDMVIRLYGLMVLLGDNGLINGTLLRLGVISTPLPLMYNVFGVIVGLVQITLPFMILSLISVIKSIHPSLEEAARSLGASRMRAFLSVVLPMSMPGILAGSLLVFALAISSYVVPALMGGWKVMVLPIHIYQQVAETGRWQFGAAIAVVLFITSLIAVAVYHRAAMLSTGGRS
ncbi:putative spermidine/putrescine transport system permease protein [Rhizobium paknamense]|uniref:Spermidine/putrescine transport system permease protein n=1 Tax=Rhizobium paknamense TaxID=1206817 RepID=A0ABU0IC12_9HYPH|nr:putative spermidine/putrescine transport system permease protein [Rhizobium paknamense]